jgi:glycosyltransferase involved in cell wall biosynthesis
MAIPVVWEGSQFVNHSLAHINRELCVRIAAAPEVELSLIPYEPDAFDPSHVPRLRRLQRLIHRKLSALAAVHVRHQWPPSFTPPPAGAWVMMQPWEFGGLPADWIAPMREHVDELWACTSWVRDCYIRSGIPGDKVRVIPVGVDLERYTPEGPQLPLETDKRFKFLFVGALLGRKGVDLLLEAYLSTFSADDDVSLVIKAVGVGTFYADSPFLAMIRDAAARPGAPAIELVTDDLSDARVAALYRACDALVHPYRGEGFGMPIAEAMASGLPVIVTNYGACLDFCDADTALLVPAREVAIPEGISALPRPSVGYWWAEPDRARLAELMRAVFDDPAHARDIGARARQRMAEFSWTRSAQLVLERIHALAERTPARFSASRGLVGGSVVPLPLEGRRKTAFFHHPRWETSAWRDVLAAYARAFSCHDDVTLVLWLDPNQGVTVQDAGERIMQVLSATLDDPEHGPDVLLVPDRLDLRGMSRLYASVDWVVPNGDQLQAQRAVQSGVRVLWDLAPEAWRAAAG